VTDSGSERPASGGVSPRQRAAGAVPSGLAEASPTWELELLLSGAVLVALFQVSGVFDRTFDRVEPHTTRATAMPLFFAYLYGKAMVLALIATFVLHLASRGYWVGLVGLNSVFPNGVRWDQLRYGPITRELIRERLPALPPIIARLDNFCSALFSFGFLLVLAFGISLFCLAVLHPITLNGALISDLELRFHTHAGNSLRGVIAYIPTAGLPRGRNLLTVQPVPRAPRGGQPRPPDPPHVIAFWL
jgi:hypothetical protein